MDVLDLGLVFYGLSDVDLDIEFDCGIYVGGG